MEIWQCFKKINIFHLDISAALKIVHIKLNDSFSLMISYYVGICELDTHMKLNYSLK